MILAVPNSALLWAKANILDYENAVHRVFAILYDFDRVIAIDHALDGITEYEMSDEEVLDFVEEGVDMFIKIVSGEKFALSQNWSKVDLVVS